MGMISKVWNFKKALSTFIEGCTGMMEVLMILMLAWGIGSICSCLRHFHLDRQHLRELPDPHLYVRYHLHRYLPDLLLHRAAPGAYSPSSSPSPCLWPSPSVPP